MKKSIPKLAESFTEKEAFSYITTIKPFIAEYGRTCFPNLKKIYSFAVAQHLINLQKECLVLFLSVYAGQRIISREAQSWVRISEQLLKDYAYITDTTELHLQIVPFYVYSDKIEKAKEHYYAARNIVTKDVDMKHTVRLRGVQLFIELEEYELAWQELFALEQENAPLFQKWYREHTIETAISTKQLQLWQRICLLSTSLFIRFGDISLAEAYLEIAKQLANTTQESSGRLYILSMQGDISLTNGNILSSRLIAEELLMDYTLHKNIISGILGNKILTLIARHEKQYEKALFYAEITYSYARQGKDIQLRIHPALLLAELLLLTDKDTPKAKRLFDSIRPFFQQRRFRMLSKNYCYVGLLLAEKLRDTSDLKEFIDKLVSLERYDISAPQRSRFYQSKASQKATFIDNQIINTTAIAVHRKIVTSAPNQKSLDSFQTVSYDNIEVSRALKTLITSISEQTVVGYQRSFVQKLHQLLEMLEQNTATSAMIQAVEHEIQRSQEGFLRQLARLCPTLTHSELKICIYLRLNLGTHDIANLLSISPDTVYTHRKRIRKKLEIHNKISLHIYLLQIQQNDT